MTHGGQEPADGSEQHRPEPQQHISPSGTVYSGPPMPPRLAPSNPRSGRQLALIMMSMVVFFAVLVALAMWAADKG